MLYNSECKDEKYFLLKCTAYSSREILLSRLRGILIKNDDEKFLSLINLHKTVIVVIGKVYI